MNLFDLLYGCTIKWIAYNNYSKPTQHSYTDSYTHSMQPNKIDGCREQNVGYGIFMYE